MFLPRLAIHTATGKASRVYSISLKRSGALGSDEGNWRRQHKTELHEASKNERLRVNRIYLVSQTTLCLKKNI